MITILFKNSVMTICILLCANMVAAQIVDIPDENFKNALIEYGVDQNSDGEIQIDEASGITELVLQEADISNITGINAFTNLKRLDLNSNEIDSFYDIELSQLEFLSLRANYTMNFLVLDGMQNLQNLNTSGNHLITELSFEKTPLIDSLQLWNNSLENIDLSNLTNLVYARIPHLEVESLDLSNNLLLTHLECNNSNIIGTLDLSVNTLLNYIDCGQNKIENLLLPQGQQLEYLHCQSNLLGSINVLNHPNIIELWCHGNDLNELDVTPLSKLLNLRCFENQLTKITFGSHPSIESVNAFRNKLPEFTLEENTTITYIGLGENEITEFDYSKYPNVNAVNLNDNLLTEIDISRENINWIDVSRNQLTSLDLTKNSDLSLLYCRDNNLEYLNLKSGSIHKINNLGLDGNYNLKHICADASRVNYLAQYVENIGLDMCTVSTYCDFFPGGEYNVFKGVLLYDDSQNYCLDSSIPLKNQRIYIDNGNVSYQFISDGTGSVTIPLSDADHTIVPSIPNSHLFDIFPDSVSLTYPEDSSYVEQGFCIVPKENYEDASIILFAIDDAIPGFVTEYKIKVYNQGTTLNSDEVRFNFPSELMSVVSASIPFEEYNGQLTWQYQNLSPFKSFEVSIFMKMNSPMDSPPLNQGDLIPLFVQVVSPIDNDITPENNVFFLDQIVVNSFDPNDKTCLQGEVIMDTVLGTSLDYLIRFENLGTANAKNVVIRDIIDEFAFDLTTLEVTDASHPMFTRIKNDRVEFIFEDINLSFQDSINDGFIAFKIRTKPDFLQAGDTIKNAAEIFFDYNFPIVTNTYNTVIATDQDMDGFNSIVDCDDDNAFIFPGAEEIPNNGIDEDCDGLDLMVSVEDDEKETLAAYPNPATNSITLNKIVGQIEFYDLLGQKLLTEYNVNQIDISMLPKGVIYLKLSDNGHRHTQKLIKF